VHDRLGRVHVLLGVEPVPPEDVARLAGDLAGKRALSTAVPLAEGVQRVELAEVVGEAVEEGVPLQAAELVLVADAMRTPAPVS
jgi:hypothetical protein